MSRRHHIEIHRQSLAEVGEIMNSMKTLAYMETRKLSSFIKAQQAIVESIENVATDFLCFYPETLPQTRQATPVYILMGTERGFCGSFNHSLLANINSLLSNQSIQNPLIIAIGQKLHSLIDDTPYPVSSINGASSTEEVPVVLDNAVSEIINLQKKYGTLKVFCLYHGSEDGVAMQRLLPPFQGFSSKPQHPAHAPILNLAATEFLTKLVDQYLFADLQAIMYTSLMVENQHRVGHLESAVEHLEDKSEQLSRRSNALRQEEITEEIEIILLNTVMPLKKV